MALVRWDPIRELDSLQSDMNRLFDRFFAGGGTNASRRWIPAMDLVETEDHLVLRGDLPGLTEDEIEIEIKDSVLTVSGERKAENEEKGEGYHRVERAFGGFSRSLSSRRGSTPNRSRPTSTTGSSRSASRSPRRQSRLACRSARAPWRAPARSSRTPHRLGG